MNGRRIAAVLLLGAVLVLQPAWSDGTGAGQAQPPMINRPVIGTTTHYQAHRDETARDLLIGGAVAAFAVYIGVHWGGTRTRETPAGKEIFTREEPPSMTVHIVPRKRR